MEAGENLAIGVNVQMVSRLAPNNSVAQILKKYLETFLNVLAKLNGGKDATGASVLVESPSVQQRTAVKTTILNKVVAEALKEEGGEIIAIGVIAETAEALALR